MTQENCYLTQASYSVQETNLMKYAKRKPKQRDTSPHTVVEKDSAGNQSVLRNFSTTQPTFLKISHHGPAFTYCESFSLVKLFFLINKGMFNGALSYIIAESMKLNILYSGQTHSLSACGSVSPSCLRVKGDIRVCLYTKVTDH